MSLSLDEFASLNPTVLDVQFVDFDRVISTEENNNIFLVIFFLIFRKVPCLESQNILIILINNIHY